MASHYLTHRFKTPDLILSSRVVLLEATTAGHILKLKIATRPDPCFNRQKRILNKLANLKTIYSQIYKHIALTWPTMRRILSIS
jgi:hypothetical protein